MKNLLFTLVLCAASIKPAFAQKDTVFWFAAPEVSASTGDSPVYLRFLSYDSAAVVTISQPANGAFAPIVLTLPPYAADSVNLTPFLSQIESPAANTVADNGIRIQSSDPVSAFYELGAAGHREQFSLKGTNALGTDFYTPFQRHWDNGATMPASFSSIEVAATENNTTVLITPRTAITGHPANVSFSVVLQAGQTYSARDMNVSAASSLAGSIISSDQPVAVTVFSGALANSGCFSPMGDQITPSSVLGKDYVLRRRSAADRVYVLATENATSLTISGSSVTTAVLSFGETYTFLLADTVQFLEANKSVYVWQVSANGCRLSGAQVPHVSCAGSYSAAFTRTTGDSLSLVVYTRAGAEGAFQLNGDPALVPASAFAPVPGTAGEYVAALVPVSLADVPLHSYNLLTNGSDIFGLGLVSGSSGSYGSFMFVSAFESEPFAHAGPDDTTCANVAFPLSGEIGGGSSAGYWSTNGFGSFAQDPFTLVNSYIPAPIDTLVSPIRLILNPTGECVAPSDTLLLYVEPAPIVNASADQTVCANNAGVQLQGSVSGGAATGNWQTTGSGAFDPGPATLNAVYVPSAADIAAGSVALVLTSTNYGSCSPESDTMVVTITAPPVVDAGTDTTYACYNNPDLQLSGSVSGASTTGKWITTGSGTFDPSNLSLDATYHPGTGDTQNGSVLLYLESTNNGDCLPVRDSILLIFTQAPAVNAGASQVRCTNDPEVQLAASTTGGSGTVVWSGGAGTFSPSDTDLNAVYTPTPAEIQSGEVILVLTTTNNGTCNAVSDNVQLTFVVPPFANFDHGNACLNDPMQLTDFSLPGYGSLTSWQWDFGDGQTASGANQQHLFGQPGEYEVELIVTTNIGCSDTVSQEVTVFGLPQADFSYTVGCEGGNQVVAYFTDESVSDDPIQYWIYDFGGQGSEAVQHPVKQFVGSGSFIISEIVETVNGCRDTAIQVLEIPPIPEAGFGYNTTNGMNIGAVFNFVDTSSYASTYSWTFGDGGTSAEANPEHTYFSNGQYVVTQTVTGVLGCVDSASATITINTVTNEISTLIPNAISPNGDGKNDVWKLDFIQLMYPNAEVLVFNQWGEQLFASVGYDLPWNAYYRGELVPDGTYFYVISLNDGSEDSVYKGSILVLKNHD